MRMSKSRALAYLWCPYKFKLDYIDGLREEQEIEEGSPLKIGVDLHEIFEKFYDLEEAKNIEEPYAENIEKIIYENFEDSEKYQNHIKNFSLFNEYLIKRYGVDNYFPVQRELEIYNEEYHVVGIIDRVDEHDKRILIDYKTGKSKNVKNYLFELSLYKYIYEEAGYGRIDEVGIYFSQNNQLTLTTLTETDIERSLRILELIRQKIKEEYFPKKGGYKCNYCEHKILCDFDDLSEGE